MHAMDARPLVLVLCLVIIAISVVDWLILRPRRLRQTARNTLDKIKAIYCGAHEYRQVRPEEFPQLDLHFYAQTQSDLEKLGFRHLGDLEDVTLARANPNLQAFIRSMLGDGGTVMAGHYDACCRGTLRLLQRLGFLPRNLRSIGMETEFSDGTFVGTSTSPLSRRMNRPPAIKAHYLPPGTPAAQVLAEHRRHVTQYLREHPGTLPRSFSTLDEVRDSQNRLIEIASRYRAKIGYMETGEMEQIASPGLKGSAAAVAKEIEKIKQEELARNNAGRG